MALLCKFRLRYVRKFLMLPCLVLGLVLLLRHTNVSQSAWKNPIQAALLPIRGEYSWNKNKFDDRSYLKAEKMKIAENRYHSQPSGDKNRNYTKINFISKENNYLGYGFNVEASLGLSIGRHLPDTRHQSILQRTPPSILGEIILVDDNSDDAKDGSLLSALPKVHVIRNEVTEGITRSRNIGAKKAEGDVLIFLDSHCEVNVGWIEPLIDLLTAAPKALVSPIIDRIDRDDFEYLATTTYFKGGFDWRLHYKWIPLTEGEVRQMGSLTHPFWSPVIAGGMFAVNKDWFFELGAYDSGFKGLGAEETEISLKSWLCGGSIYICPCSRIGHIFRSKRTKKNSNHANETFIRNAKRVAEIWMDEYKVFFYQAEPSAYDINIESLKQSMATKQNLECKSFKWFLKAIYPELKLPDHENIAFGQMKQGVNCLAAEIAKNHNMNTSESLQSEPETTIYLEICDERSLSQQGWTYGGRMKSALHKLNKCLTAVSTTKKELQTQHINVLDKKNHVLQNNIVYHHDVELHDCNNGKQQKWTRYGKLLYNNSSKLCLQMCRSKKVVTFTSKMALCLRPCMKRHSAQMWDFTIEIQSSRNY